MDINIVEVNQVLYGLPTVTLREILDPVAITQLPFAPTFVDGLVNISGNVMVQMDLAQRLNQSKVVTMGEGQLAVVDCEGEKTVLHIDRALLMVSIPEQQIHWSLQQTDDDEIKNPETSNFVVGEFRWQDQTVLILAVDQLGLNTLSLGNTAEKQPNLTNPSITAHNNAEGLVAQDINTDTNAETEPKQPKSQRYLVVAIKQERYALAMENVNFVAEVSSVSLLPHAPPCVLGMTYTHDEPYLVLALDQLLGHCHSNDLADSEAQANEANNTSTERNLKLVAVQHQDFCCVLSVTDLQGIQQLACQDNHEMLNQDGELSGYLVTTDEQLIGVLNFEVLFSEQKRQTFQRFLVNRQQREASKKNTNSHELLTFRVGDEQCALPLALVDRVVQYRLGEQTPHGGAEHLHGMIQIQGDVLPVADLRKHMGMTLQQTHLTAYVVAGEQDNRWALVVDQINRVIKIPAADLETTSRSDQQYITAIGRINNSLVSLIDIAALTAA